MRAILIQSLNAWIDHRAGSKGAALAFYTLFSMTPILVLAIAGAGYFFGADAAQGEIILQVEGLVGRNGAQAIQALLLGARDPAAGFSATMIASVILLVAATSVFVELKGSLDEIWGVEPPKGLAVITFLRTQLHAFGLVLVLAFLLLFRLGEAQALKLVTPFLLDPLAKGGLGLTTSEVGLAYGTVGVTALTLGGLLGGYTISRGGLKKWIWPMLLAVHVPNLAFIYPAYMQPSSIAVISTAIAIEQFGYGFGFASYLLFMIMVADGPHKTAHYAICTGFMALGMMLPGMASGWIQTQLGYPHFFIWVLICCVPSLIATAFVKIDPAFGKKQNV